MIACDVSPVAMFVANIGVCETNNITDHKPILKKKFTASVYLNIYGNELYEFY